MILPHDTLVLLADGAHLLVLRNRGDAVTPDLEVIAHRKASAPANRDLVTDAPGTSFSSASPRRSSYDQTDAHQGKEERFLIEAADALAEVASERRGGIIVAAPPSALGILRRSYSDDTRTRLIAEFDKDLTALPVDDVTRWLLAQ